MNLNTKMKAFGRYNLVVENTKTGEVNETGWQDNLVLKKVLYAHRSDYNGSQRYYVWFGSGSTTPTVDDSGLENAIGYIAGSYKLKNNRLSTIVNNSAGIMSFTLEQKFVGATGQIQGNISELGMNMRSRVPYDASFAFTRALIKDEFGNPTTITLGEFDKVTLYYNYGWELDLKQELLNTTIDYKGTPINVVAKFVDWNMLKTPHYYSWDDVITEPGGSYNDSYYAMVPNDSGSKGNIGPGTGIHLYGSVDGVAPTINTTDVSNLSGEYSRIYYAGSAGSSKNFATSGDLTISSTKNLVLPANSYTGSINAIVTSNSNSAPSSYYGGRVAFMFDPPLEKLASDEITIEYLSFTFSVA